MDDIITKLENFASMTFQLKMLVSIQLKQQNFVSKLLSMTKLKKPIVIGILFLQKFKN